VIYYFKSIFKSIFKWIKEMLIINFIKMTLKKYTFNNTEYYLSDDIYNLEPQSFIGCSKTTRLIIKNKKLKKDDYIFMKYLKSTNEWKDSEESYRKAKLFITVKWTNKNLICFKNSEDKTTEDLQIEGLKAPPLLILDDNEKFVDKDGNKLEIEIRGTKDINNIYFRVKDVSDGFKLKNIRQVLLNKESGFNLVLHYKIFKIHQVIKNDTNTNKKNQNYLYLTFKGLTKLLYVSHSKNAEHFQDWVNKIIYTVQFGSKEDKINLYSSSLGIHSNILKDFLNTETNTLPCLYLFTLGKVKDLRESMNINNSFDDEEYVCKFGITNDLKRRTIEHEKKYLLIQNANLYLKYHSYIDPLYLYEAENELKLLVKNLNLNLIYNNSEEIIVLTKDKLKLIESQYKHLSKSYMGKVEELNSFIKDLKGQIKELELEKENIELKHQIELTQLKHQNELLENKYQNDLLKKEIELLKLSK